MTTHAAKKTTSLSRCRRRRPAPARLYLLFNHVFVFLPRAPPTEIGRQAGLPAVSLAAILNKVPGGSERMANVTRGLRGPEESTGQVRPSQGAGGCFDMIR